MIKWHKNDLKNRMHLNIEGGKKIAMPRYFKDRIYTAEERGYLKGYFEAKREQDLIIANQKGTIMTDRDAREAITAAFTRMYRKADEGRTKI